MAYNPSLLQLTGVLQQLFRRLGGVVTTATDGSETLAIDTKFEEALGEGNVDDFLNGGTLIVVQDAGGANAAPEGEFSRIEDYDSSTQGITLDTALSAAIATGDKFMYIGNDFPLYDMVEVVNDALRYIGEIPVKDESITTAEGQTEYTLPVAIKGKEILDVEFQSNTDDADDNQYYPVEGWKPIPITPGTSGVLVLPQLPAGHKIRVTYVGIHPRVDAFDDYINEHLHPDFVHACVFAHAVQWKNDQNAVQGAPDNALLGLEQKAWSQFDRARILHPVVLPPRRIQGLPHWTPATLRRNDLLPPYYGA
jgi:hypothetical protein